MSTLKPSHQKFAIDARVFEVMGSSFPEFKCTITDIKFPKKDFVVGFYTCILELLNINIQKVMIPPTETQMQGESHREIYLETMHLVNLSQSLRSIFNVLQRDGLQFGLEDLVEPTNNRNSAFMFTLLNFFNFADSRMSELTSKLEVIGLRKAEMENFLMQREKTSRELNQRALMKAKRHDAAKEIKSKKAELDEVEEEAKHLLQIGLKKQADLEDTKRHRTRVQTETAELRNTYQKLEAQLVQSPDVLKSNFKHCEDKLREMKQQLEQAQETAKEKKKTIKLFESVEKDLDMRLTLVTEIVGEANTVKKFAKELKELSSEIKLKLAEIEASQNQINGFKKDLLRLTTLLTNLQLQDEKKKSSLREQIRHLQEEKQTLETRQSSKLEETLLEIDEVQGTVNDLLETNDKLNKLYERIYAALTQKEQELISAKLAEFDAFSAELELAKNNL